MSLFVTAELSKSLILHIGINQSTCSSSLDVIFYVPAYLKPPTLILLIILIIGVKYNVILLESMYFPVTILATTLFSGQGHELCRMAARSMRGVCVFSSLTEIKPASEHFNPSSDHLCAEC